MNSVRSCCTKICTSMPNLYYIMSLAKTNCIYPGHHRGGDEKSYQPKNFFNTVFMMSPSRPVIITWFPVSQHIVKLFDPNYCPTNY